MRNLNLLLFVLLFFSYPSLSHAKNFVEGYIITLSNDTVYGYIDLGLNKVNATRCIFKDVTTDMETRYLPGEIKAYHMPEAHKYYVSHVIAVHDEQRHVFLELLVDGIMNLYNYEFDQLNYFFFEDESGKMVSVWKRPDEVVEEAGVARGIRTDNRYELRLKEIFRDIEPIEQRKTAIPFNQKTMVEFTKLYHSEVCTTGEDCIVYVNENPDKRGVGVKFSLYAGIQNNYFSYEYMDKLLEGDSFAPVIGFQAVLYNERFSRYFSLLYDFSFFQYNINTAPIVYMSGFMDNYRSFELKSNGIMNRVGVRYTYVNRTPFHPVVEVGAHYINLLSRSFELRTQGNMIAGEVVYGNIMDNKKIKKSAPGIYISAGLDFKLGGRTNAIFIRGSFENNLKRDMMQDNSTNQIRTWSIKTGYTF